MSTGEPRVVDGSPSTLPLMLKAALPVLPGVEPRARGPQDRRRPSRTWR